MIEGETDMKWKRKEKEKEKKKKGYRGTFVYKGY